MKTNYLLAMVLLLYHLSTSAQLSNYYDSMEDYTEGEAICAEWWTDWDDACINTPIASSAQVDTGTLSAMVPGDSNTNALMSMGNKIFGYWYILFWMYIPSDKEATFNIQGMIPVHEDGESVVGDFKFNPDLATPGQGYIEDTALGQVDFTFPHDEWFRVFMHFDISGGISIAEWTVEINEIDVIPSGAPGTPFTDFNGTTPTGLGGINFSSLNADHLYYIDNVCFTDGGGGTVCSLSTESIQTTWFTLSPNPATETLVMISERATLQSATIYNLAGSRLQDSSLGANNILDVRSLPSGIYFIEITSDRGKEVHRFVKQ